MKNTSIIIAASVALIFAVSCKKDIADMDNTYPGFAQDNSALRALLQQHAPPVQTFTFNASSGGYFQGVNGATLYVAPNAFTYQNNGLVTGNVTLNLQEVYTKSEMIFSGGYTTANGLPLVSGGEINVTAYQGAQELRLAYSGAVYATIPTTATAPSLQMFGTSGFGPQRDFELLDSSTVSPQPDSSFQQGPPSFQYAFALDSLDWSNCDQYFSIFYNTNDMTEFSVPVPTIFNDSNCMVFVTSSYATFAGRIWDYDEDNSKFLCNYYRLPVGLDFTFTIVGEINGTFYYDSRTVTITEDISVNLNPAVTPEAQVIQNVNNL